MSLHFIMLRHPNYAITEQGEVYSAKTKKHLKHSTSNTGYLTVYVDGNKLNNELNNLEWCTYGDNERHAYRTGLKHCGDRIGDKAFNRKLTSDQVAYIKKVYKKGDSTYGVRALAKIFNVSQSCISSIMLGHSWGGV